MAARHSATGAPLAEDSRAASEMRVMSSASSAEMRACGSEEVVYPEALPAGRALGERQALIPLRSVEAHGDGGAVRGGAMDADDPCGPTTSICHDG